MVAFNDNKPTLSIKESKDKRVFSLVMDSFVVGCLAGFQITKNNPQVLKETESTVLSATELGRLMREGTNPFPDKQLSLFSSLVDTLIHLTEKNNGK